MDAAGLPALIEAIRHLHGLEATWLESVPVVETHEGQTVWAGEVQVFAVEHPKATRVYAWSHEADAGKRRFHAVKSGHYPSRRLDGGLPSGRSCGLCSSVAEARVAAKGRGGGL